MQAATEVREMDTAEGFEWSGDDIADYDALFDAVTGLPRRALLRDRLNVALAQSARTRRHVAVIYFALGAFPVGGGIDTALQSAAAALSSAMRPGDTVARVGDAGFVVVCPEIAYEEDMAPILERLLSAVNHSSMLVSETGVALGRGVSDATGLIAESINTARPRS